jgi:hypothetical protein
VPQIEHRLLHEAGIQLADAGGHEAEQALSHGLVGKEHFLEDGSRHHASLPSGERRDVGGAGNTVESGQLAEKVAGPHLVKDDLLAGGRAHQDPHLSG